MKKNTLLTASLFIAVAVAWFLSACTGSGDAPKANASPVGNQSETSKAVSEEMTLIPILDSKTGKDGFIDSSGNVVIPFKYDYVDNFFEGLARVRLDGKYGFIDKSCNVVIPFKYDWAFSFSGGRAYVKLDGRYFYIDKSGNEIK